jgi:hypothetical protein
MFIRRKRMPAYTPRPVPHGYVADRRYGHQQARAADPTGFYYQLVESYRDGGRVRQRLRLHLGRHASLEAYRAHWTQRRDFDLQVAEQCRHPRKLFTGEVVGPNPRLVAYFEQSAARAAAKLAALDALTV